MQCRGLVIVIMLIIFAIIGIIILKIMRDNDSITEHSKNETFVIQELTNNITDNATKINNLLTDLITVQPNLIKPKFILQNIDTDSIYNSFGKNISSNIKGSNSNLSIFYNTSANTVSNNLSDIENTVSYLEDVVDKMNSDGVKKKNYSRIKSLNNGQEFTLFNTENTLLKDSVTGYKIPGYLVGVNNGCLSVGANDYDVYKCDDKNRNQYFKMEHIMNKDMYQNTIDTALPLDNVNFNKINYPFVMLKSLNTENCLTNNHGSLTVQPCYTFESQRWFAM